MESKTILTFMFLLELCSLSAQTDYRPRYIITLSNDTVFGQIDYSSWSRESHIGKSEILIQTINFQLIS